MRNAKQIFDDLCSVYDYTTEDEFNKYLEDCDWEQIVNLCNEILEECHCVRPRYCWNDWDSEQIIDTEIRCWKDFEWKRYEIIIEDQYWNDVKTIDEIIDDMLSYEAEARDLYFNEAKWN